MGLIRPILRPLLRPIPRAILRSGDTVPAPDPDPDPQPNVYDPNADYPHLNGDGYVAIPTWTAGADFTVRGRVTPTIAGTRVLVGQLANTNNYISFFANSQRLGVKLGSGTAQYITKDYLNTEVEFTLTFSGGVGTLTWGVDSVQVTPGASPIEFDTFGRNSISFSPYDGWMQEMDLTTAADTRSYDFSVAGQVTDALGDGSTDGVLSDGLDATDWAPLP